MSSLITSRPKSEISKSRFSVENKCSLQFCSATGRSYKDGVNGSTSASHSVCRCNTFPFPPAIVNQPKELVAGEFSRSIVAPYIRMNRTASGPEVNVERENVVVVNIWNEMPRESIYGTPFRGLGIASFISLVYT
jgi:hypothetical protein